MSFTGNSLISVITPVYNGQRYLTDAIESVLAQTYPHWEMWIINDASSDESLKVANCFGNKDKRINIINSTSQVGAAKARNLGISASNGRFISFLDADDCWLPNKLERQVNFMLDNNYAFTYTGYETMDSEGKTIAVNMASPQISRKSLLTKKRIGCLTAMYDTACLGKVEMPLIGKRQDLGLWLKLLNKTELAYGINDRLAQYRSHKDSMSANKLSAAIFTWRLYRRHEHMSLPASLYYFMWYAIGRMLRTFFPKLASHLGFD
jgi:glycosyltransferase involved in cell wall biosynthesis